MTRVTCARNTSWTEDRRFYSKIRMVLTCSNFFSLLRTPAKTAWRRLDLKRYVTLPSLLVVGRVQPAERHQCGRRTLVYVVYTNCREVKQGISFFTSWMVKIR